jgi:hypothetical protein
MCGERTGRVRSAPTSRRASWPLAWTSTAPQIATCDVARHRHRKDHYVAVGEPVARDLIYRFEYGVTHFTGSVAT